MGNDQYSPRIEKYFKELDKNLEKVYTTAKQARKKGFDPKDVVEIPLVKDMAERVEGLVSVVEPKIIGSGISKRIKELEKKYGSLDWRVSLIIAYEIAQQKFCKFKDKLTGIDIGIRVGFAYHTMGTVSSPLEGFVQLKIKKRKDNKEYIAISYAGPIRSAGGTGASVSVLIVDYVCRKMGYDVYDATEQEVKRFSTELYDYHDRITNLQYLPSTQEIEFMAKNLPVEIDGEASEKIEVSNYKDLERVETNNIRNGVCLVLGEGLCQKAEKLWKQISKWGKEFDLEHWFFLKEFLEIKKKAKSKGKKAEKEDKISPDYTFIKDLVAGRPVFTHPMKNGGFRLRYGRSRTSGFSSYSIHPATMYIMNKYLATGTQLKIERPGKGATVTPCDSIEGPIVKLRNGNVVFVTDVKNMKDIYNDVKEIIYIGDILINYGDFLNRAHKLVPPGYCEEWWLLELEKATVNTFGALDFEKLASLTEISSGILKEIFNDPCHTKIKAKDSIILSENVGVPIHPRYTYHYNSITREEFIKFTNWIKKGNVIEEEKLLKIILHYQEEEKRILEILGIPHKVASNEFIVIEKEDAVAVNKLIREKAEKILVSDLKNPLEIINSIGLKQRDKNGLFIGCRMGRPEKAKMRKLTGSPHVLFPVGDEGGRLRCFQSSLEAGKVTSNFPMYYCGKCEKETINAICEVCGKKTKKIYFCRTCGNIETEKCKKHPEYNALSYKEMNLDIKHYFENAIKKLGMKVYPDLIKGVRGTSNKGHIPEQLVKGILRAKHNLYVNKDGTIRYDMTQLPITHFKPKEIGTSIEKLKEMGYEKDIYNKPLEDSDQVLELIPQDLILPSCSDSTEQEKADDVLYNTALFIDELLQKFYGIKPFYNLKEKMDIVGHLVLGLAPHTSAGIVGRVIGFSKTQGMFAHPIYHAATRRDCDGDEACVILLLDALINFSKLYLPAHRGATQDAPLVLTSHLVPAEVDDMVFDMDVVSKYGLEFYNACLEYKNPWDIEIDTISKRLNTQKQYEKMFYTHETSDINKGIRCSAYKLLPTMEDKLKGQMELAEKIRAVEESDVARLVIEKHFIKDIKGNIRKFSMQQFRCVKCNKKYRRPPLSGKCNNCSAGKIIFTISEGSAIKYLEPSISLAEKYHLPPYLQQTLMLTKHRVEMMFGKDKERQEGLGRWFG